MLNKFQEYILSTHTQFLRGQGSVVMWHSLFGSPMVISCDTMELLLQFSQPRTMQCVFGDEIGTNRDLNCIISELISSYYLLPPEFDEYAFLNEIFQARNSTLCKGEKYKYLELIMCEECNFRCKYCIHFGNLELSERLDNPKKFMTFEMAKSAIDQYIYLLRNNGQVIATINFGGGEPLLNWSIIKRTLEYVVSEYSAEFSLELLLNTNASLIDYNIALDIKKYGVSVASSLDGLQKGNDEVRIYRDGNGTFEQIMKGFSILRHINYPLSGFSITVTSDNFYDLEESIIDFAVSNLMSEVRIDIDVINNVDIPIDEIVSKLVMLRSYAKKLDIEVYGFWSRPGENLAQNPIKDDISFCGAVRGNSLCVSPSGLVYACGYSNNCIGHVSKLHAVSTNKHYQDIVLGRSPGSIEICKGCIIESQCAGGCEITREFVNSDSSSKIERMCEFYRKMTLEILHEILENPC